MRVDNPVPCAEDPRVPMLCETWQNRGVCISASAGGSLASKTHRYMWVPEDTLMSIPHYTGSMGQEWGGCGKASESGKGNRDIHDDSVCEWLILRSPPKGLLVLYKYKTILLMRQSRGIGLPGLLAGNVAN